MSRAPAPLDTATHHGELSVTSTQREKAIAPASETSLPTSTTSSAHNPQKRTNEIHFVLQGKGGVGKSFVATLLAEYFSDKIDNLKCFDTDPVNPTFASYKVFDATRIELFDGPRLVEKNFDSMMIPLLEPGASGLIDNGAPTFVHLMNYMTTHGSFEMLVNAGKTVVIHTVVAGGDAMPETINGFRQIMEARPNGVNVVVWLNELFGKVSRKGEDFIESPGFKKYESAIAGLVTMPKPWGDIFEQDLQMLRQLRVTLGEAIGGENNPDTREPFNIMERQRFTMVRRDYFQKMKSANI